MFPNQITGKLNLLSRNQTWLPLFILIAGALCGLVDDYLVCRDKGTYRGGGLSLTNRLFFVFILGALGAWWFYVKLGMNTIHIPFGGDFYVGVFFIPIFITFIIGIYSGGIIDGIDGLSGGVFASIYLAYAIITFANGQIDLAAYSAVVVGGLLAFLWFNIPPARFFNSETGTMALTTSLVVVAFLTKAVLVLPIIAFLLVVTSASSIIQILSKKYRGGKKVFPVAPLHNPFQALGWPPYKVVMRYWVLSMVFAVFGVIIALIG
jgi:phospho-N-acetylmuramoyl-pentapeptide-transferase